MLSRVEREVTVLLRRSMEDVWAAGYGSDPAMRVALTPAGDAQVAHVLGGRTARLGEVLAGWSTEDGDAHATLLRRPNTDLDSHRRLPS